MNDKMWNAEEIRSARKARGITQGELAAFLGCRLQTVSEWETGIYEPQNAYRRLLTMFFEKKRK
jgi:DNA-binding transcriptional regulator YiaG